MMSLKKTRGIYAIRQLSTGKMYVGSTHRNFYDRFCSHRSALRRGKHSSILLQRAWDKHGESDFTFEVLEVADRDLHELELSYIKKLSSDDPKRGFNLSTETSCARLGHRQSEESKRKISAALRGTVRSPETRRRMSEAKRGCSNPMFGSKQTEEAVERRVAKLRRPVVRCDGIRYSSVSEAARHIGCKPQSLSRAIRRGCKIRGFKFSYVSESYG